MQKMTTLCLALLVVNVSSAQWKKVKGNGNVVTVERSTGDYEVVSVSGFFNVDLVAGQEGSLTLKGEENLLDHIITEVKDGKLVIKAEKGMNLQPSSWKDGIHITVPVERISEINLSGSGDIVGKTTLKSNRFTASMSGSGDITLAVETTELQASMSGSGNMNLSGEAGNFEVRISGSGDVKAYELKARNVEATVSGSADIKVTVQGELKARVSGSGDIHYRGNPTKIDSKSSGSGNISRG